jgi:hypothetical protein
MALIIFFYPSTLCYASLMNNSNLLIVLGLVGLFAYVIWYVKSNQPKKGPLPYIAQPEFLTVDELKFFRLLVLATSDIGCFVLCKIRVGNLLKVDKKQLDRSQSSISFTNMIKVKYIDFVVCDSDMKPNLFIELNDSSRKNGKLQKRDDFLKRAFQHAGLKYMRFSATKTYEVAVIKEGMTKVLGIEVPTTDLKGPVSV